MANKSSADLKAQFAGTDPADHNTDLVDSLGTTVDASATVKGKVELATSAETITGSSMLWWMRCRIIHGFSIC